MKGRRVGPLEPCPCESGLATGECHRITQTKPLRVAPTPAHDAPGYNRTDAGPILTAKDRERSSGLAFTCGECGQALVVGLPLNRVVGLTLGCGRCGKSNRSYR